MAPTIDCDGRDRDGGLLMDGRCETRLAWGEEIIREIGTPEKYRAFFGKGLRMKKVIRLPKQAGKLTEAGVLSCAEQERLSRGAFASRQRSGCSERQVAATSVR